MLVQNLYQQYPIPDNLAEHMLLTAAMGEIICQNWTNLDKNNIDQHLVVTTLLTHDLGNIIKFNLNNGIEFITHHLTLPKNSNQKTAYWQEKKQQMIKKYGQDCNLANIKILQELGLEKSAALLQDHTFERLIQLVKKPRNWHEKIVHYCDLRLIPTGLSTVKQRVTDLQARYQAQDKSWADEKIFQQRLTASLELETELNQQTTINLKNVKANELIKLANQLVFYEV